MNIAHRYARVGCVAAALLIATITSAAPPLSVGGVKPVHVRISLTPVVATQTLTPEVLMIARMNGVIDLAACKSRELVRKMAKNINDFVVVPAKCVL